MSTESIYDAIWNPKNPLKSAVELLADFSKSAAAFNAKKGEKGMVSNLFSDDKLMMINMDSIKLANEAVKKIESKVIKDIKGILIFFVQKADPSSIDNELKQRLNYIAEQSGIPTYDDHIKKLWGPRV